jgi:signal transduction histidine kinase
MKNEGLGRMTSFDAPSGTDGLLGVPRPADHGGRAQTPLERVREVLGTAGVLELGSEFDQTRTEALQIAAGAGGSTGAELAAIAYASEALVALAAEGELISDDVHATVAALAEALGRDLQASRYILFSSAAASPRLLQLPPLPAAGIQLQLLLDLGLFQSVSLWRRAVTGQPECVLQLGSDQVGRRARGEARAVLRGRTGLRLAGKASLRSVPIVRFDQVVGAVVAQASDDDRERSSALLAMSARALGPVLERELLLERSRSREQALVSSAERRLMRLAFDLHDGPIQDVLALAADVSHFQQQLYPFVLDSHREQTFGRFDDLTARLSELDRMLREIAHSLESKSIVSRPVGEILHREVDTFAERAGIDARLEIRGDPDSLNSAQRVAIFRAIQEALANVREHSGATEVEIRLRARRNAIDVRITDNGAGFEVGHALARAAKRGRLGVVGIGERVRMLGGTFELDSQPGGPTTLSLTLPRWQQDED